MDMRFDCKNPPRKYAAGFEDKVTIRDCGTLQLDPDEQVTFVTDTGREYDVTRKEWGFYATPSLNGRLSSFGLRGVLVRNRQGRYFMLLVEVKKEKGFEAYRASENLELVAWLDTDERLNRLAEAMHGRE
jgi:hypothetical protein